MSDALKAAVREALECSGIEVSYGAFENFTSALARRGVVVAGEPIDFPYYRTFNAIAGAVKIEAGAISISVDKFQTSFNKSATVAERGPDNSSSSAPSESSAPKPARKVVQIAVVSPSHKYVLYDDGTVMEWRDIWECWSDVTDEFPQPGDEQ